MPAAAVTDPQVANPPDADGRPPVRRIRKRRRRPRTIVGAWAAASTEAGFWLGTAFAGAAIGAPLILGLAHLAVSGDLANLTMPSLSHGGGVTAFYLILALIVLIAGWVVGSISGLALGVLNGLVLLTLSRAAAFRAATAACQGRLAAGRPSSSVPLARGPRLRVRGLASARAWTASPASICPQRLARSWQRS